MDYRLLGKTGLRVSAIGFGASPLGNVFDTVDPAQGERAVHYAIDHGINFFDVSPYYGRTLAEERLGVALAGRRDQVVLATKCGRYDRDRFDFSARRVKASVEESLRRLRTDRLDLLQAHDIEFGSAAQIAEETIPALRELQQSGKVRFIGISSYQLELMANVASAAPVDTILSYCRYNLLVDDMDMMLTPFVRKRGIGLILASPLHMGLLSGSGAPAWHPAPANVIEAAGRMVRVCEAHGVEPAAVALRFCLDHSYAATTLVGMSSETQVRENLEALDMRLSPQLLDEIRSAAGDDHNVVWPSGAPQNQDYREVSVRA